MINGVPRILIVRLSAIGDVVRVLPALHAMRDLYPNAQIDFAVENKAAGILENHPAIDRLLVFDRSPKFQDAGLGFLSYCNGIRKARYDILFDFHGIAKSGMIMAASRAAKRYAFAPPRAQELSYLAATDTVPLPAARMNRIEENLELVKAVGAKRHTLDVIIEVPDEVQDEVDTFFHESFDGAKQVVMIHAPVDRPEKQWPLENYASLCDMLLGDGRYEVLLTWGPGQREVVQRVQKLAHRNPRVAPAIPTLKHLAWMTQCADLFFGGDTGPMHIASAMETPIVAVFGGTDPAMHAPLRQPSIVLYAGPEPPAKAVDKVNGPANLALITPAAAYDACVRLAHGKD